MSPQRRPDQSGASLLEVLVSVLVLSLGVFAVVGLQTRAVKGNHSAYQRTQAVLMTYYIVEAMRVDSAAAKALDYNSASGSTDIDSNEPITPWCSAEAITKPGLAGTNLQAWMTALKDTLGDSEDTCGAVYCNTTGQCRVQVQWDDSRAGGLGEQTVQTITQL